MALAPCCASGEDRWVTLFDTRTARILFTVTAFVVGMALIYVLRSSLVIFLFAVFFAYLMEPLVSRLELLVRSRAVGSSTRARK